jgi:hypothetical protein
VLAHGHLHTGSPAQGFECAGEFFGGLNFAGADAGFVVVHEFTEDGVAELLGVLARVEFHEVGLLNSQKDVADAFEVFGLFEVIGGVAPGADAREAVGDFEVEEDKEVGLGRELFVAANEFGGIESARALIRRSGKVVAVNDHDVAGPERGHDECVHVFAAVFDEGLDFFFDGESAGGGGVAEDFSPLAIGRFLGADDVEAAGLKVFLNGLRRGGFARAINAFDDKEESRVVRARVHALSVCEGAARGQGDAMNREPVGKLHGESGGLLRSASMEH